MHAILETFKAFYTSVKPLYSMTSKAKRSAAAKKAARTRKRNAAARTVATRKAATRRRRRASAKHVAKRRPARTASRRKAARKSRRK